MPNIFEKIPKQKLIVYHNFTKHCVKRMTSFLTLYLHWV